MIDFNKKFIDIEELQREIIKLKNELINAINNKALADTDLLRIDIQNIKSSKNVIRDLLNNFNIKITDLYSKTKEATKVTQLETMINANNTARISKDEELKREIDDVIKTVALEFKTKFVEFQTLVSDTAITIEVLTAKVDNKNKHL